MAQSADSPVGRRIRSRGELVIGTRHRDLTRSGVRFRPRLTDASQRNAHFADGTSSEVDVVLWATGFRPDYAWIDVPGVTDGHEVRHRRGVTEEPGLYFVGLPWQHTRGSALLGFVEDDAEYVSGALVQRHDSGAQAGVGASPSAPTR
jgi:putative flavoprotein involved in K+ transport